MRKIALILMIAILPMAVSCLKSSSRQSIQFDCSFEASDEMVFDPVDSTCFSPYFVTANLVSFGAKLSEDGKSLEGGFGLCQGVDPKIGDFAAKTPLHCISKPYSTGEKTFAVFRQSGNMPEDGHIFINIPNEESMIMPQTVLINNTHNFVVAVRQGNGLAGGKFASGDWAAITFKGYRHGTETGSASLRLADYEHFADSVVTKWTELNLHSLGSADRIDITLTSSREDMVEYVCLDHMKFSCTLVY